MEVENGVGSDGNDFGVDGKDMEVQNGMGVDGNGMGVQNGMGVDGSGMGVDGSCMGVVQEYVREADLYFLIFFLTF